MSDLDCAYYEWFFFFNDTATTEIYTRSLVGSGQMCIRDRPQPQKLLTGKLYALCWNCNKFQFQGQLVGYSIDPVSYTHLRAHETVLDLVCRLLLEKNKLLTSKCSQSDSILTIHK